MIQTILGFCGYVKIPTAVVQLSLLQEDNIKIIRELIKKNTSNHTDEDVIRNTFLDEVLEGQKSLTQFLRSGRLLNGG